MRTRSRVVRLGLVQLSALIALTALPAARCAAGAANQPPALLSDLVDVSPDFRSYTNDLFLADSLAGFDPASGQGQRQSA